VAGSLNKVQVIGNLGKDPEIRTMQNGGRVANLSVATSEQWKDRQSGERREKTEWHRVVVFNDGLVTVCENYLSKGSKVYLEGQIETRKFTDQSGQERYTTEVVLRPYKSELIMLDSRGGGQGASGGGYAGSQAGGSTGFADPAAPEGGGADELEDEIPF
jgi:single-strand DNA-binding protein